MKTVFAILFAGVFGCALVQPAAAEEAAKYKNIIYSAVTESNRDIEVLHLSRH